MKSFISLATILLLMLSSYSRGTAASRNALRAREIEQ